MDSCLLGVLADSGFCKTRLGFLTRHMWTALCTCSKRDLMRRGFINSMAHNFNLKGILGDSSTETQKGTVHIVTKPGKRNVYSTTR